MAGEPSGGRTDRRAEIRLNPEEVERFLAEQYKVQVATVGPHGAPHLATLFYAVLGGRLAFWTYGSSQKVLNLRRDPRVTCLVDDGTRYEELRGAVLYGTAEISEDPATVLRVGAAVAARMAGSPETPMSPEAREALARSGRRRVAVFVTADRVVSWDHAKLG